MRQILHGSFLLLLIFLCGCKGKTIGSPESPVKTSIIVGTVLAEPTYEPIFDASISTQPNTPGAVTSSTGEYMIAEIQPKEYSVTATKTGYDVRTITVDVDSGGTVIANFRLIPTGWGTTIDDTLAPLILTVETRWDEDDYHKAIILMTTNEPARAEIEYGIAPNTDLQLSHSAYKRINTFVLTNLQLDTSYLYHLIAVDNSGNTVRQEGYLFRTLSR